MLVIESVIKKYGPASLLNSHLYASNEPCPMCVGACIWSGVHNVTYFLSQEQVTEIRGWGRFIQAKAIALADDSGICINGPNMNEDMLRMHEIFWRTDNNSQQKHSIHLLRSG
jgi:tRNA(Arg) A34 adenosine deaminase TadA